MADDARAIARDLIAEIGRPNALAYVWTELRECDTWRARGSVLRLMVAVVRAS